MAISYVKGSVSISIDTNESPLANRLRNFTEQLVYGLHQVEAQTIDPDEFDLGELPEGARFLQVVSYEESDGVECWQFLLGDGVTKVADGWSINHPAHQLSIKLVQGYDEYDAPRFGTIFIDNERATPEELWELLGEYVEFWESKDAEV